MFRVRFVYLYIVLSVFFNIAFPRTESEEGRVYPPKIDFLKKWFADPGIEQKRGLIGLTDSTDWYFLNRNILELRLRGLRAEKGIDDSYRNFIFATTYDGYEVFLPYVIDISRYYENKKQQTLRELFVQTLLKKEEKTKSPMGKIELVGADIAGQRVSLRMSGNISINGKLQNQSRSQVRTGIREGRTTSFIIDQKQQLNIEGKIGDRISLLVDQDSEREFDFENNLRVIYTGDEDEIIQKIEAGNVSLNLQGTQFATYSGKNSGLFGFKTSMKLGGINITTIASVERSEKNALTASGGETETIYTIDDYDYRKNLYFFLDMEFRRNMYPLVNGSTFKFDPNRIVSDLKVYRSVRIEKPGVIYGVAYVDPNDTTQYPELAEKRLFELLEQGKDYEVNRNLGFIRLSSPARDDEIIAVAYRIIDSESNTIKEYGDWDRSPEDTSRIVLKLIKPQNMLPNHPCWDLEFKNVYYLGSVNINPDGFELKIIYTRGKTKEDEVAEDGQTFLQKFGLDIMDKNGNPVPDDIADIEKPAIFNLQQGELWFPFLRPFQYGENDESGERNPNLSPEYSCSAMYDSSRMDYDDIYADKKFQIVVKYKNRSSTLMLKPMIIEGSESVTLNGQPLRKGVDYTIDYFSGTLTLLKPEALDPNADLKVTYETNELFQVDKKTILGARAEYNINEESFIGLTTLYYSKSVMEDKVELGYEPMRNFLWDINGRFSTDLHFINKTLNYIPGLNLEKPSTFRIEGELARIVSNPNTINNPETGDFSGVGFVDDFEGSKRTMSPPVIRRYWVMSSAPLGTEQNERGFLYWYNPFGGVPTKSIWPNKDVSYRNQTDITEILVLGFDPFWSIAVADGVVPPERAWGGITYSFPPSYYDQSKTKFIEIWVKGDHGRVHIDLGEISEDINGNGILDKEDKPEEGSGFQFGNGTLDPGEDVGIDGVPDEEEYIVNSFGDTLRYGNDSLKFYKRDPEDPHSDNWKWSESSTDYRKINGTEGNSKDASGLIPDTEDLNSDFALNDRNDYFTVSFYLDERGEKYVEGQTVFDNGVPTGWKLYRIPLKDFEKANPMGNITWQNIKACRIWVDEFSKPDTIMIAKIEFVSNEWEELGVASGEGKPFTRNENVFAVKVINTEDNVDTYKPPSGVEGEYDRINDIRLKEQSLVLWFDGPEGLKPGYICAARKDLREDLSFINYKKMRLFIHGHNIRNGAGYQFTKDDTTGLLFFIRFGDNEDYYEYRQPIFTDNTGSTMWDPRNKLDIDLDFITQLKAYSSEEQFPDNGHGIKQFWIYKDEEGNIVKRVWKEVKDGRYTGRVVVVNREPTVTKIKTLTVGLINANESFSATKDRVVAKNVLESTLFGEVWIDELRLSEVRKEPALAYRANIRFDLSDLAGFSVQVSRKDADYHTVEQKVLSDARALNTTRNFKINGTFKLGRLLPRKWQVNLPISASYSNFTAIPKYFPGRDILTGDTPPDSIISRKRAYGLSAKFNKKSSDYWLTKYTIDQMDLNFNASFTEESDIHTRIAKATSYNASFSYRIPFGRENYIKIFQWAESIPFIGASIKDTRFYYTPSNMAISISTGEARGERIKRFGTQSPPTYSFGLNRNFKFGYKIFDNLNFLFNKGIKSDLRDFKDDKLRAIQELKPGRITGVSEGYNLTFNPKILSFLKPNFSYSSNYTWSEPLTSATKSVDIISNQNRMMASVNFSPNSIIELFYKPKRAKSRSYSRPGSFSRYRRGTASKQKQEKKDGKEIKFLESLYSFLSKFQPISVTYSVGNSVTNRGRIGHPGVLYRIGLQKDPGLPIVEEEVGLGKDNIVNNLDLSMNGGLKISNNVSLTFNYMQNHAVTESQMQRNENLSRGFFPLGKDGRDGIPFPSWSLRISGLQKIPFLKEYVSSMSADHGFSGKEVIIIQNGREVSASYSSNFQPLFSISASLKSGINGNLRFNMGRTITVREGDTQITENKGAIFSLSYHKRGGLNIPLPFMNDVSLENDIKFNLNFDFNSTVRKAKMKTGKKFTRQGENWSWKITPTITYSFTNKVSGSIFFEYGESFDIYTGKRVNRNGGFNVNIAIRG
ncbi:MAG: cell surface protein SprA [Candidatus Marinimicrobia bacterium]|nr:cell surface protein SprA [Candidatus Neomarinimicrobiota bacterium]